MLRKPAIRRVILADRSPLVSLMWSAGAVLFSTALRWAIDKGEAGIPFVTYFPVVVAAALLLGWRWGALVALVSAVVANQVFRALPLLPYLIGRDLVLVLLFALSCAALIWIAEVARRLVRELEQGKARETLLNQELAHRVKNMLATVTAMAVLTARHCPADEFPEALAGRMEALKRATDLLEAGVAAQCGMQRLAEGAVAPFRSDGNFVLDGPACELPGESCVPLALALHELCTNAMKYGALSAPGGRVVLLWTVGEGEPGLLRLSWREEEGPPVARPARKGMGTQLLRRQRGLRKVEVDYPEDGATCDIEVEHVTLIEAAEDKAA